MTRDEIKNTPELVDYLLDKNIIAGPREKLHKRMEEICNLAIQALEQKSIDKFAMMHEIYMEGVNMGGEYQGCWVRFKDIEKIVDKYIAESEGKK